ncbi:mucin-7-like [Pempheris klunzingeri]|uniref:mucin-7-like n=1 Tax=Pempheris klunzingeri TaxID=3127111 RepID=UPI0039808623
MKLEIHLVFGVLVVLTGSSQTRGQDSALPPVLTPAALPSHTGASASPALTGDPGDEGPRWTPNPAGRDETSAQTTTRSLLETATNAALQTHLPTESSAVATSQHTDAPVVVTAHPSTPPSSAAADSLSSTPTAGSAAPPLPAAATEGGGPPTREPLSTSSSQPGLTGRETSSTAGASTLQPQSVSPATAQPTTTGRPLTSAPGARGPVGPTHQDVLSELNVGDEDLKGPRHRSSSPLDPLLAGLLSVFIVTTAVVFIVLFLKFRQRTNHPEFHRLQDLPMDDLMEDTPLSRYAY